MLQEHMTTESYYKAPHVSSTTVGCSSEDAIGETMPALIEVDRATERLRDGSLAILAIIYILPVVWVLPPSVNVTLTASLTVFSACLRTVGRTNEAELVSKKVSCHISGC